MKNRKQMENKFKQFYVSEGHPDPEKAMENHISVLPNRDKLSEDAFLCKWCTDHCYLSMMTCNEHTVSHPSGDSTDEKSPIKDQLVSKYEKRKANLNN